MQGLTSFAFHHIFDHQQFIDASALILYTCHSILRAFQCFLDFVLGAFVKIQCLLTPELLASGHDDAGQVSETIRGPN